jgi:hypothetical protein
MFHIGIADMVNIIGQIIFGVITVFSLTIPIGYAGRFVSPCNLNEFHSLSRMNHFISNTMSGLSWFGCTGFVNLLALNRLLAFDVYTTFNKYTADRARYITKVWEK